MQKGGEDSVVYNEIQTLKKYNFNVHYKEYNNLAFTKLQAGTLLIPLNIFFNLAVFFRTFYTVLKHKINVVHVHNVFYTVSPSVFWGAKLAGARTVYTVHNYRLFCLNGLFFLDGKICTHCHDSNSFKKGIEHKCFKQSTLFSAALAWSTRLHRITGSWRRLVDRYVAINPFIAELLIQRGIAPEKITLKPNYSKDFGSADYSSREDFYFFAGRLQEEKGIYHLVDAFKQLNKSLVIAGNGELAPWVKANTSAQITYAGQLDRDQMQTFYKKCRAIVFSSTWLEGMPMAIIEAQSAGAIPIVARTKTTVEMIAHGVNGFLYEAGSAASLIDAVEQFEQKSTAELNEMSDNARRKFLNDYEEQRHLAIIEKVYTQ